VTRTHDIGRAAAALAHKRAFHLVLLFLMGASYSLLFAVNKLAVTNDIPYLGYVFWQSLGGGLFLLVLGALRRDLPRLDWQHLRTDFVWGGLAIAAPISLLTYIAPHLPAGLITMTLVLVPLCTYVLALLFRVDRFRVLGVLGLLFGLAGVLLIIVPGVSLPTREMAGWLLLALLAPVMFGLATVFTARFRPPASSSLNLSCGLLLGSALLMVPVMLGLGQGYAFDSGNLTGDVAILYAGLLNAWISVLFLELVRLAGPVFTTQHNYIATLAGFGWGVLFFGEGYNAYIWGATALMFIGLTLHNLAVWLEARRARAQALADVAQA
jgi:drug/metabolite transporter (DMT)-like permease